MSALLGAAAWIVFIAGGVWLSIIDIRVHRLPNRIVASLFASLVVLIGAVALIDGEWSSFYRALICTVLLVFLYFVMAVVSPQGMGMGDVKYAAVIGLFLGWLGWDTLLWGTVAAFILGGLSGLWMIVVRKAGRRTQVAFGPYMAAGALLAAVLGRIAVAG